MDAVEVSVFVEEFEALHVPGHMAVVRHDLELRHGGDEASFLLLEVAVVGGLCLLEHFLREARGRLALGVEVALLLSGGLGRGRTGLRHHMPGESERGTRSKHSLGEFAASAHNSPPQG